MIRKIQHEDAEIIKNMYEAELGHSTSVDIIQRRIQELSNHEHYYIRVFVDDLSLQVVGFIQAEKYNLLYGGNGWNVIAMAVTKEAQRNGVGKALLLSLENYAKEMGYTFVRLNSNILRTDAHAFYKHLGYRCDKSQKRFIKEFE